MVGVETGESYRSLSDGVHLSERGKGTLEQEIAGLTEGTLNST